MFVFPISNATNSTAFLNICNEYFKMVYSLYAMSFAHIHNTCQWDLADNQSLCTMQGMQFINLVCKQLAFM